MRRIAHPPGTSPSRQLTIGPAATSRAKRVKQRCVEAPGSWRVHGHTPAGYVRPRHTSDIDGL
eukprot:17320-Eustigmatos_ZCMA.PRE.1